MKIDNVDKVREAKKQKEGIQVICYVSEAALAVATSVFEWTVPAASLFGVPMKFISDWCNKDTLEGEYVDAVDRALKSTKETFRNYHSKLQIIDGLSARVGELDEGLADAIKKTEEYQLTYSTEIDARDIIVEFERHFRTEIAEHHILSNFYVLRTSETTLDILKKAKVTIDADSDKIESIYKSIDTIGQDTSKISKTLEKIADITASSSIVFCFFLIASTLLNFQYNLGTLVYTCVAIIVSECLIRNLPLQGGEMKKQVKLAMIQVIIVVMFVFLFVGRTSSIDNIETCLVALSIALGVGCKILLLRYK